MSPVFHASLSTQNLLSLEKHYIRQGRRSLRRIVKKEVNVHTYAKRNQEVLYPARTEHFIGSERKLQVC